MQHPRRFASTLFLLASSLGLASPAAARLPATAASLPISPVLAQQETLFTFGTLIYAASSIATPAERDRLQPFLLTYRADAQLDGLYPIRREVAAATARWPITLRRHALDYLLCHSAAITNFNAMVLQTVGGAPTFISLDNGAPASAPENKIYRDRQALAALLRQAWRSGNVDALWQREQLAWSAAQPRVSRLPELAAAIVRYTHTAQAVLSAGSQVVANPLMPMGSGVTSLFAGGRFFMVIGPTASAREQDMLITHELLHPVIHAMMEQDDALAVAIDNGQCSFAAIANSDSQNVLTHYVYTSWESYLSEVMIRSISHRLTAVPEPASDPFLIAPEVSRSLTAYEGSGESLAAATRRLSERLGQQYCRSALHV